MRRPLTIGLVRAALFLSAVLAGSATANGPVDIVGGPDPSGRSYEWQLTNRGSTAVVAVEFPHYGAALFTAPDGWRVDCTNLVNVGVRDFAGACKATSNSSSVAITPGKTSVFRMQCASGQGRPGVGVVTLIYAGGRTEPVSGVALPEPEPMGDRFVPLIGMAVLAAAFAIYKTAINRRSGHTDSSVQIDA